MPQHVSFKNRIFSTVGEAEISELTLEVFRYQAKANPVYRDYLKALGRDPSGIKEISRIPFLPISFFKSHAVVCDSLEPEIVFTSSGTGGKPSRHLVADLELYRRSFTNGFAHFYGKAEDYCVLALLPSYMEREGSSLVYMADHLIRSSADADSGFFLDNLSGLHEVLLRKIEAGKKVILLGVSFALLDLAESYTLPANEIIIMETGGMKGRRKELVRSELHEILKERLGVSAVHSEYGMTELLSQAYAHADGRFKTPPWMRILIRETDDPFSQALPGKTGGINVIDLANYQSCSFIETQDLGRWHENGEVEVMGRFDNSDIRGCNLLVI